VAPAQQTSAEPGRRGESADDDAGKRGPPWKTVASELLHALATADTQQREAAVRVIRALIENLRARS